MPILLFRLNGVPEDEADDVRNLLAANDIDFYETHAGRWGISVAAIWLKDDSEVAKARALLDHYQEERYRRAREAYEARRREGRHETLADRFAHAPIRFLIYMALMAAVLFVFLAGPFMLA